MLFVTSLGKSNEPHTSSPSLLRHVQIFLGTTPSIKDHQATKSLRVSLPSPIHPGSCHHPQSRILGVRSHHGTQLTSLLSRLCAHTMCCLSFVSLDPYKSFLSSKHSYRQLGQGIGKSILASKLYCSHLEYQVDKDSDQGSIHL